MRVLDRFHGGLRLAAHKAETDQLPMRSAEVPDLLYLPIAQHIGVAGDAIVRVGQHVMKGQLLVRPAGYVSAPIHAPSSGTIRGFGPRPVVHPGSLSAACIVLEPDGKDQWVERIGVDDFQSVEPAVIQELIYRGGVVGFGGAGFPTHVKVREGIGNDVETLIVNGAECEPYITCDNRLMQERAAEVVSGTLVLAHAVQARECVIAVEDDMPTAQAALSECCAGTGVELVPVPNVYPTGGEKQLTKVVTGKEVPSGGLPIQTGVMVQNVATAAAVYRVVCRGEPVISRIVTLAGEFSRPGNVETLLGTPVRSLLALAGGNLSPARELLCGGPMMGVAITDLDVPITKVTNCILLQPRDTPRTQRPCIRCGACNAVCPVGLQAQALYDFVRAADFDTAQDYALFDCIECGCCAYVCPSSISLVDYYRYAKSVIEGLDDEHVRAEMARDRFRQHLERLVREAPAITFIDAPDTRSGIQAEIDAALSRNRDTR